MIRRRRGDTLSKSVGDAGGDTLALSDEGTEGYASRKSRGLYDRYHGKHARALSTLFWGATVKFDKSFNS